MLGIALVKNVPLIIFEIKLSLGSKKLVRVFNNRLSSLVVRGTVSTLSLHW